jgi:hypothetical protein
MTLILDGKKHDTRALAGDLAFTSISYVDDPRVPRATDFNVRDPRERDTVILGVLLHTVHGKRGALHPGSKSDDRDIAYAKYQANTARNVSWDFTVGRDGDVVQSNDPVTRYTWHAGARPVNRCTVGVEAVQDDDGGQYEATMRAQVALAEFLCERLHIPRVTPINPDGTPFAGLLAEPRFRGVYGHRNIPGRDAKGKPTAMKPFGDPGDHVFHALLRAGFLGAVVEVRNGLGVLTGEVRGATQDTAAATSGAATPLPEGLPARTPPVWLDAAREVPVPDRKYTSWSVSPEEQLAFVVRHARVLRNAFNIPRDAIAELVAHAATESGWGRAEVAHNAFGVKVRQSDNAAHRAKHGEGLRWYARPGHIGSGDAAWAYYRAFDSAEDAWAFWLKRYVPRPPAGAPAWEAFTPEADVSVADYNNAGRAFWQFVADAERTPADAWFVEMLLAGYRGSIRADEVRDAVSFVEHLPVEAQRVPHPSVVEHRRIAAAILGYLVGVDLGATRTG